MYSKQKKQGFLRFKELKGGSSWRLVEKAYWVAILIFELVDNNP